MDDFPARLAAFLESTATRVRAMTVDRVAKVVRMTTLGIIVAALGVMATLFLFLTIYGALEIPLGRWGALAVIGGLFLLAGVLVWAKRAKEPDR